AITSTADYNSCMSGRAALWPFALLAACGPPPAVFVKVEDPQSIANAATTLAYGAALTSLTPVAMAGRHFPTTIVFTEPQNGARRLVWFEAQDSNGTALARGRASLTLLRKNDTPQVVQLWPPCDADSPSGGVCALADGSGTAICVAGACIASHCGDGYL